MSRVSFCQRPLSPTGDELLLDVGLVRRRREVPGRVLHGPVRGETRRKGQRRQTSGRKVERSTHVWFAVAAFDGRWPYCWPLVTRCVQMSVLGVMTCRSSWMFPRLATVALSGSASGKAMRVNVWMPVSPSRRNLAQGTRKDGRQSAHRLWSGRGRSGEGKEAAPPLLERLVGRRVRLAHDDADPARVGGRGRVVDLEVGLARLADVVVAAALRVRVVDRPD